MNPLIDLIRKLYPVSDALTSTLSSRLKLVRLPANEFLLTPGQVSSRIYFVEKGLVRGYYLKEHKEFTTGFLSEGQFVISPVSFYRQEPSFEYLELLEDCLLWELHKSHLDTLYSDFPEFNFVGRLLTEQYYSRSELRAHYLRTQTADEKYRLFMEEYATISNRVTNRHIASLLGLTPETISRIRAKKQ